jgi:hypothetical protein
MGFYGRLLCSGSRAFKPNCPTMVLWQSIARALMLLAEPRVANPPRCSPRRIWRSLYSPSAGDDADRRGCGRADIDVAEPEREPTPVARPRPSARRRKLCEHGAPSRAIAAAKAPALLERDPRTRPRSTSRRTACPCRLSGRRSSPRSPPRRPRRPRPAPRRGTTTCSSAAAGAACGTRRHRRARPAFGTSPCRWS